MKNVNINQLTSNGYPKDCIIKYGQEDEVCSSYAVVWFLGNEPIIAEPYGAYEGGRWFYNREVDFEVSYIEDPTDYQEESRISLEQEIMYELEELELIHE